VHAKAMVAEPSGTTTHGTGWAKGPALVRCVGAGGWCWSGVRKNTVGWLVTGGW